MKPTLLICLLAVSLAGCSSLDHRQISHYQDYGISDSLYAKMQAHRKLTTPDIVELSQRQVRSSEIMTYLAYSDTQIPLTDEDARQLARQNVKGDVITYLRENPNSSSFLSVFKSWDLSDR